MEAASSLHLVIYLKQSHSWSFLPWLFILDGLSRDIPIYLPKSHRCSEDFVARLLMWSQRLINRPMPGVHRSAGPSGKLQAPRHFLAPNYSVFEQTTFKQQVLILLRFATALRFTMPPWPGIWSFDSKGTQEKENDESVTDKVRDAVNSARVAATPSNISNSVERVSKDLPPALRPFAEPQTLIATAILTTASLALFKFYRSYLRRIPEAGNINPSYFRKRSVFGKCVAVGDGDNFRIYHTPGGWLAGWGWLPWRRVPMDRKVLKNKTVS